MSITVIILIVITLLSILGGWLFSRSKEAEKAIKVLTFMLYFWLFAFVQLMFFGLAYHYNWIKF